MVSESVSQEPLIRLEKLNKSFSLTGGEFGGRAGLAGRAGVPGRSGRPTRAEGVRA